MVETVAVPVNVIESVLKEAISYKADAQLRPYLPKAQPRLVAVTREHFYTLDTTGTWYDAQPDLLTLIDEAIDGCDAYAETNGPHDLVKVPQVKARIRAALGVTE